MTVAELAAALEDSLRACGTPERAAAERAYLKSSLEFFGASVPDTRRVVKQFLREHRDLPATQVRQLANVLWDEPIFERRSAAVMLLVGDLPRAEPSDMDLVERFIRGSETWALVDPLSTDVAGGLVVRFPELSATLDRWATDDNFWLRRASLLTLLIPLRRGGGDWDHFVRLAEPMLGEREFFIRKALGWVLRETAKRRPELVEQWLRPRLNKVSRLTLREAIKPLSADVSAELLGLAAVRPRAAAAPS